MAAKDEINFGWRFRDNARISRTFFFILLQVVSSLNSLDNVRFREHYSLSWS